MDHTFAERALFANSLYHLQGVTEDMVHPYQEDTWADFKEQTTLPHQGEERVAAFMQLLKNTNYSFRLLLAGHVYSASDPESPAAQACITAIHDTRSRIRYDGSSDSLTKHSKALGSAYAYIHDTEQLDATASGLSDEYYADKMYGQAYKTIAKATTPASLEMAREFVRRPGVRTVYLDSLYARLYRDSPQEALTHASESPEKSLALFDGLRRSNQEISETVYQQVLNHGLSEACTPHTRYKIFEGLYTARYFDGALAVSKAGEISFMDSVKPMRLTAQRVLACEAGDFEAAAKITKKLKKYSPGSFRLPEGPSSINAYVIASGDLELYRAHYRADYGEKFGELELHLANEDITQAEGFAHTLTPRDRGKAFGCIAEHMARKSVYTIDDVLGFCAKAITTLRTDSDTPAYAREMAYNNVFDELYTAKRYDEALQVREALYTHRLSTPEDVSSFDCSNEQAIGRILVRKGNLAEALHGDFIQAALGNHDTAVNLCIVDTLFAKGNIANIPS